MKKVFTVVFLITLGCVAYAQNSFLQYTFNGHLNESNGNAPALSMTGTNGSFITDTLPELGNAVRSVYRFNQNSGLRFFNDSAANFLGKTYTIEMYFRFDNLGSWKRVIDWKNRKSDGGAYFFNNQLNFYPIVYSGVAPVVPNEYTYYVVTRDSATRQVLIYADANVHATFTDNNDNALLDSDNILNFFQDDNAVPNEASAGAIAQLKIYNYKLSDTAITQNYTNLPGEIMSAQALSARPAKLKIYPNPATDEFRVINRDGFSKIQVYNSSGQLIETRFPLGNSTEEIFSAKGIPSGIYLILSESRQGIQTSKLLVP